MKLKFFILLFTAVFSHVFSFNNEVENGPFTVDYKFPDFVQTELEEVEVQKELNAEELLHEAKKAEFAKDLDV